MTRIADRLGLGDEVDEFVSSVEWVDLLEVVRAASDHGSQHGAEGDGAAGRLLLAYRRQRGDPCHGQVRAGGR